jgi:hypothetical protein
LLDVKVKGFEAVIPQYLITVVAAQFDVEHVS